jgi:threonine/homoserine/homoserine lactone efflux protein
VQIRFLAFLSPYLLVDAEMHWADAVFAHSFFVSACFLFVAALIAEGGSPRIYARKERLQRQGPKSLREKKISGILLATNAGAPDPAFFARCGKFTDLDDL